MMVLFSGIGQSDPALVQDSLKVGMGALSGSTILALTLAYGIMIIMGRVDMDATTGQAMYNKKVKLTQD